MVQRMKIACMVVQSPVVTKDTPLTVLHHFFYQQDFTGMELFQLVPG